MPDDPVISAVVAIRPPTSPPPSGQEGRDFPAISKVKSHLTSAGFEVAAPLGRTFTIAAPRSRFEQFFGEPLVVDDEGFRRSITTEGGGRELSLDALPEELREKVESVSFLAPPEFPLVSG
ncbi:MAG: hypothetical protein M3N68_03285 [Actinomycetota bacterium]|nr:hypothetical protein [Actinomycetota bacterium]